MSRQASTVAIGLLIVAVLVAIVTVPALRPSPAAPAGYTPQVRTFTVTAVPLLVHEMQGVLPYLKKDFGKGGLLQDKEVFGFIPGTIIVYQGDTVRLNLINPTDDDHIIAFAGLAGSVTLKASSRTTVSFVAKQAGLYTVQCVTEEHMPFMYGQIVVLRP